MEGIQSLGINLPVLLAQIINIAILFVALYFLLFKSFLKTMEERKQKIQEGLEKAERAEAEAARAEAVFQERMEQIEREREVIIVQAKEEAERLRAEAVGQARKEAREEARRILAQEREMFDVERQQAVADMHNQVISLVMAATRKVVEESIDEPMQYRLINRFLSEVDTLGEIQ
ncbi:MAG: F0F1 ATP synthase subunit B [Chloroflexota bacterium]|nr:F0F1 ATP synthase subunit B [Chloroflexota bacterium]